MPQFLKIVVPPVVGGVLAFLVMFGIVWSQTQPPETNPTSEPILRYGD